MLTTMNFIRTFFFSLLVGGGLFFQSATPAFGQSDILLQLRTTRYELDRSASDSIDRAIEILGTELDPQTSPILVWKLKNSNQAFEQVVLALDTKELSIKFDSGAALRSPINGQLATWTSENLDKYDLITRVDRGALVQTVARDSEYITRTYTEDANTLTILVEVTNPRLPRPLTYKLIYNRAS
jgi:hypothetical protein